MQRTVAAIAQSISILHLSLSPEKWGPILQLAAVLHDPQIPQAQAAMPR